MSTDPRKGESYPSPWDATMFVAGHEGGRYLPAIPLPLFLRFRKQCQCGEKFWRLANYQRHWQIEHSTLGRVYWEPDGSGGAH